MLTFVCTATEVVVMVKVAVVSPEATVMFAGTGATVAFELVRPMSAPPAGAGVVRVTVATVLAPPASEEGWNVMEPTPLLAGSVPTATSADCNGDVCESLAGTEIGSTARAEGWRQNGAPLATG